MTGRSERIHELAADLVAAGSDARTDSHKQIVRPRAELAHQCAHGGGCHSGSRAAPSGMNGGNGTALGIGKEQWDAIGGTNSDRHAECHWRRGHRRNRARDTWRIASERHDVASVHLIEPW